MLLCSAARALAQCRADVSVADVLGVFQAVIPTSDGSLLAPETLSAELILRNIRNNLHALGGALECSNSTCVLEHNEVTPFSLSFYLSIRSV